MPGKKRSTTQKQQQHKQVIELHCMGFSSYVIAEKLKMRRGTVVQHIKDQRKIWTDEASANYAYLRFQHLNMAQNVLRKLYRQIQHSASPKEVSAFNQTIETIHKLLGTYNQSQQDESNSQEVVLRQNVYIPGLPGPLPLHTLPTEVWESLYGFLQSQNPHQFT